MGSYFEPESGYFSRYNDMLLAGRPGFDFRKGQDIFPFSTVSRPVLGPTQTRI
jgi:hypothetical protein